MLFKSPTFTILRHSEGQEKTRDEYTKRNNGYNEPYKTSIIKPTRVEEIQLIQII